MNGRGRRARRGAAPPATLLGAAGCGGEPARPGGGTSADPAVGTVPTAADGVQEVTRRAQDDHVPTPDASVVASVRDRLTGGNVAEQCTHAFRSRSDAGPEPIREEIELFAPGESRTVEFSGTRPAEHLLECPVRVRPDKVGTMTVDG